MEVDDFVERVEVSCISIPFCEVYGSAQVQIRTNIFFERLPL